MIYVFIDIDGVFNSRSSDWNKPGFTIDLDKVNEFNQLITDQCFVVLSSSWRSYPDQLQFIKNTGLIFQDQIPPNRLTQSRYSEILNYINEHNIEDNFIIVDDDGSVRNVNEKNLVYTQFNIINGGLNKQKMEELKNKLDNLLTAENVH